VSTKAKGHKSQQLVSVSNRSHINSGPNLVDFLVGVDLDDGVGALLGHQVEVTADCTGSEDLLERED